MFRIELKMLLRLWSFPLQQFVQSGSLSLVDPQESLSRNSCSTRCGSTISARAYQCGGPRRTKGVSGWSGSQIYKWWKRVKKVFFAETLLLCELWRNFLFSTCSQTISEVFLYCEKSKLNGWFSQIRSLYMYTRVNFSTKKSARCEG